MRRSLSIGIMAAAFCMVLAPVAQAQTRQEDDRFRAAQQRLDSELATFRAEFDRYQQARSRGWQGGGRDQDYDARPGYDGGAGRYSDERDEGDYDPARYYRDGPNYRERTLASDDRVYRGNDGRYYCKRSDGTTGLILGAAGGGILGNVIDGGRSRTVGTLIGGALGALAGRSVEQNQSQIRCR
ncbi:glycine zipper 2TM domain-containing protein [Sphingobium sp.]|uniref:glycine zipper 2TM domain-containing protein n=1 Tax=Sphingobium sp. TaxID=1912891 RepID=UPI0029C06D11|nr:glycine zipper 2TM domain-containing protein [Sphingobium sp.]